jgi:hypothetical protein
MIFDPAEVGNPESVSIAKVDAAAIPFSAIARRMLGPAADELAEMSRYNARTYRYQRQVKCIEKAVRMAQEAGFTPQAVRPKILFPLLEGASFEDREDLDTMWAALLANASSPGDAEKVRPGFIAILKQMSPDEVESLKLIANITDEASNCRGVELKSDGQIVRTHPIRTYCLEKRFVPLPGENAIAHYRRLNFCLQILGTAGLIEVGEGDIRLMPLGDAFLHACCPPKPKA